ncbi:Hypothetical protein (plasmid) [Pseudomonas putida]|nr:Hypothetical protein [Pseudomonas putida]
MMADAAEFPNEAGGRSGRSSTVTRLAGIHEIDRSMLNF